MTDCSFCLSFVFPDISTASLPFHNQQENRSLHSCHDQQGYDQPRPYIHDPLRNGLGLYFMHCILLCQLLRRDVLGPLATNQQPVGVDGIGRAGNKGTVILSFHDPDVLGSSGSTTLIWSTL